MKNLYPLTVKLQRIKALRLIFSIVFLAILLFNFTGFMPDGKKDKTLKRDKTIMAAPPNIGDFVWEDLNGNGIQDSGEPGIEYVNVSLYDNNGNLIAGPVATDANGNYSFEDLAPGDYYLYFDISPTGSNYVRTLVDNGSDNEDSDAGTFNGDNTTATFTLSAGESNMDMDAGFYIETSISGFVWEDTNGNGVQDSGEPEIPGATVRLLDSGSNELANTTTDGSGNYIFDNLAPGDYIIKFDIPAGYDGYTFQNAGGDDNLDSDPDRGTGETEVYSLESNTPIDNIDAGFYKNCTVGDYVWEDMDGNGIQDAGEPPVENIDITLQNNTDGSTYTTTSNASGYYEFSGLMPGNYSLYFNFGTSGMEGITKQYQGSDTALDSDPDPNTGEVPAFDIASGETNMTFDAGFYRGATVGDYVWRDGNQNGIQENEFALENVIVELIRVSDGASMISLVTNSSGTWGISGIPPDEYYLQYTPPSTSFVPTIKDAGTDDNIDSDIDGTGRTDNFHLMSGESVDNIDAGFYVLPPPDCDDEAVEECENAPKFCDLYELNEWCSRMPEDASGNGPTPLCPTDGWPHNISWWAFVANATTIHMILHVSNCVLNGNGTLGVQYGIYTDCTYSTAIICEPGCQPPGDIDITASGLQIGQTYYFFLDGCNGTVCDYWIEILDGYGVAEVNDDNAEVTEECDASFADCLEVCVGAEVTFTLEDIFYASRYIWTVDGVVDSTETPDTTIQFLEEGTYQICVYGKNDCDVGDEFCITVEVSQMDTEDLGQEEVCIDVLENGYTPTGWGGDPLTGGGVDSVQLTSPAGCIYWQKIEIIELPRDSFVIDTAACYGDIIDIEGHQYDSDVTHDIFNVPGTPPDDCEDVYDVTTHFMRVEGYLVVDCSGNNDGTVEISFVKTIFNPADYDNLKVTWLKDGQPFVDENPNDTFSIITDQSGEYSLDIEMTYQGVVCIFSDLYQLDVNVADYMPETPIPINWDISVCSNDSSEYIYEISNADNSNIYEWIYPPDVSDVHLTNNGSKLRLKWYGSGGGEICVYAFRQLCGYSDTVCQTVEIVNVPEPDFIVQDTICMSSSDTIVYTGNGSDDAKYLWNFSGGTDSSNNADTTKGPHYISWNTPGLKVVSLSVIEGDCQSEWSFDTIYVQEPPQPPVIVCGASSATSVTFTWDSIAGASNTTVEVLTGQSGVLNGTEYFVNGLNPLDEVTIVLHIETNGYCPPFTSDTVTCQALDCPIIDINVTPNDTSICYDGSSTPFQLTYTVDTTAAGVIRWSGNGIVDTLNGIFNPDSAGVGTHTVLLRYMLDDCPYTAKAKIHIYQQPNADFGLSADTICLTDNLVINYQGNAPAGNASWDFDGASVLDGSGLAPHTVKWNSPGTKNLSLSVEENGCYSDTVFAQVYVYDTLDNIIINCEPSTDSVAFSWNTDSKVSAYKVYINGTLVDSAFVNSFTVNGLNPGDSVSITIVAIDKGICGDKAISDYCFAVECPEYNIQISPYIDTICLDDSTTPITFTATDLNGEPGTVTWSGTGIDPNTGVFDPKAVGQGTYTIHMRYKGICSKDSLFDITVIERPVASFSVDKETICISDSVVVTFQSGNPPGTEYNWNLNGGTRTDIDASSFYVKWDVPGTYDISLNTNNVICASGMVMQTVTVEPRLEEPAISCDPTTNSIRITWNDIDCAASYNVFVDSVMVLNTTATEYDLQNLQPNSTVVFRVEAVSECACPGTATTITCETEPCPEVSLSIENLPENQCESSGGTVQLKAVITGDNSGILSWEGPGIDANGAINTSGLSPGQYIYTLYYELSNCNYYVTDTLNIIPLPQFTLQYTDPVCKDDENGTITIAAPDSMEYYLNGTKIDDSHIDNLPAGEYTITVKDRYGCETSKSVTLTNPDDMEISITGSPYIKEDASNNFQLSGISGFNVSDIIWHFEGGDTLCHGVDCTEVDISISHDDSLCVDVIYNEQCVSTACMGLVYIENVDINIPNIFTPDGDGINDLFFITTDATVEIIKELKIFDRWGELVFAQKDFPPNQSQYAWDGKHNGKEVLPGVYVYYVVFKIKGRPDLKIAGDLTLIK